LKDNQLNRNDSRADGQSSSSKVSINGGTHCYQAPELFSYNAKFSRRADVFAAGVIFLELLTLQKPNSLYRDIYPAILKVKLPDALLRCLSSSLDFDPEKRIQFTELLALLRSEDGKVIGRMESGSKYTFDEVEADIRLLLPSSKYECESGSGNRPSGYVDRTYKSSSVMEEEVFGESGRER
jgi:serine/threonine protein kinase